MATTEASQVEAVETTYDTVPYASYLFPQTCPNRLATVAPLFGMKPVPVERCRELELGCAAGSNLISMAALRSESRFCCLATRAPLSFSKVFASHALKLDGAGAACVVGRFLRKF